MADPSDPTNSIKNLHVSNCGSDGVVLEGGHYVIENASAEGSGGDNFRFKNAQVDIRNATARNAGRDNFHFEGGSARLVNTAAHSAVRNNYHFDADLAKLPGLLASLSPSQRQAVRNALQSTDPKDISPLRKLHFIWPALGALLAAGADISQIWQALQSALAPR